MKELLKRINDGTLVVVNTNSGEFSLRIETEQHGEKVVKVERLLPNQPVNLSARYPNKNDLLNCAKLKEKILKKEIIIQNK